MGDKKWSGLGAIFLGHGGWSLPGAPHFPLYQCSQQGSTGVRGSSPGGHMDTQLFSLGRPQGCWSDMFCRPGAFGGEQRSSMDSPAESQCCSLSLSCRLLPSSPEPPGPTAWLLFLLWGWAWSTCASALPEPSREELMEDTAEDADAHQPRGPSTTYGDPPYERLRPWEETTPASTDIYQRCHRQSICFLK